MAETCEVIRQALVWVEGLDTVPVTYIAEDTVPNSTRGQPLLEFGLHTSGSAAEVSAGPLRATSVPGTLIVNNGHFGYRGEPKQAWCCWVLSLDISRSAPNPDVSLKPLLQVVPVRGVPRLAESYEAIQRAHRRPSPMQRLRLKAAVLGLLAELYEGASDEPGATVHSPAIEQAMAIMHRQQHDGTLTIRGVAQAVGLSEDHFGRRFRAELGVSPGKYLAHVRMERACALLQRTTLRVKEVAAAVGFGDGLSFSKAFRRHAGACPRQYRGRLWMDGASS
jgi:AraC-like DNA-binding protein